MSLLSPTTPLLSLDWPLIDLPHIPAPKAGERDNNLSNILLREEPDADYDPCKEFLNDAAFETEELEDQNLHETSTWRYPSPFQDVCYLLTRSAAADFSPCSTASGETFPDTGSSNCNTPLWNDLSASPSPSVSSIAEDVDQCKLGDQGRKSLLWETPDCTPDDYLSALGPLLYTHNTSAIPEIILTSSGDIFNDPSQYCGGNHTQNEGPLLSPSGLFSFDLLPTIDETIPPSCVLYELSDDDYRPSPVDADAASDVLEEFIGVQHQYVQAAEPLQVDESYYSSGGPPSPVSPPPPRRPRTRFSRASSDGNRSTSKRHSPYARAKALLESPTGHHTALDLEFVRPEKTPETPSEDVDSPGSSSPQTVSNDNFKSVVGSHAVILASASRRKRPAKFSCDKCSDRTFTSAHNLRNHVNSHLGRKDHKCEDCGKRFTNKHDLTRHVKKMIAKRKH